MNYIERNTFQSLNTEFRTESESTVHLSDGEISVNSIRHRNDGETVVVNERTVRNGLTRIIYENGAQAAISTKDNQTNCETWHSFSPRGIYEHTNCGDHEMSRLAILEEYTFEKKCVKAENLITCGEKRNDKLERTTYDYHIGKTRIHAYKISPDDTTMHYAMWKTYDIPNGEQTDEYDLDLPDGSPFPGLDHSAWELTGTSIKTGYIPEIQKYAFEASRDQFHMTKSTIEFY